MINERVVAIIPTERIAEFDAFLKQRICFVFSQCLDEDWATDRHV